MRKIQILIVLALAAIVFGGGGYLIYDAFHPYRNLGDHRTPRRYIHPIVHEIERARKLHAEGKLSDAQQLLRKQLRIYGKRPEAQDARDLLGEINTEMFFSTDMPFGKTEHVVKRGDTLWRIARKFDSTPEVIMRTNNLKSDRLQPGEHLWIPDAEFTVTLDLPNDRVVVHTGNGFFKQYPIVSVNLPRPITTPITTRVKAVNFWKGARPITTVNSSDGAALIPRVYLASGGYVLYGVSEEEDDAQSSVEISQSSGASANPRVPRQGFALLKEDLDELQLLISRGTPVTIIGGSVTPKKQTGPSS